MKSFFCENCNKEVSINTTKCPSCNKEFESVMCPICGFTGKHQQFTNGCPSCGYLKERKIFVNKKNEALRLGSFILRLASLIFVIALFLWLLVK